MTDKYAPEEMLRKNRSYGVVKADYIRHDIAQSETEKLRAALVVARDALDACGLAFQWLMQDDLFAKVSTKSQCIKAQHMAAKCAEDLTSTIDAALYA